MPIQDLEFINGVMEMCILVYGIITIDKDKVNLKDKMEIYMMESGIKIQ